MKSLRSASPKQRRRSWPFLGGVHSPDAFWPARFGTSPSSGTSTRSPTKTSRPRSPRSKGTVRELTRSRTGYFSRRSLLALHNGALPPQEEQATIAAKAFGLYCRWLRQRRSKWRLLSCLGGSRMAGKTQLKSARDYFDEVASAKAERSQLRL